MHLTSRIAPVAAWVGVIMISLFQSPGALASLTLSSGLGTSQSGNLVANGSFELGAPPDGIPNAINWVSNPPPLWSSTGPGANSTLWGNDGLPTPYKLKFSDNLDGSAGIFFGNGSGTLVSQPPSFNLVTGEVTFPSPPVFVPVSGAPTVIGQTVPTHLTPSPYYKLSFWVSGEENSTNQGNTGLNIIGFRITNVLAGNPIQYLAVPNGLIMGSSHLYEYTFTPLVPTSPVTITFMSWGKLDLSPWGGSAFGTEAILDDVRINAIPEPAAFGLGLLVMLQMHIDRSRRQR